MILLSPPFMCALDTSWGRLILCEEWNNYAKFLKIALFSY